MKKNQLALLDEAGLFNLPITGWHGREFVHRGKNCVDFSNTNYLGYDFQPLLHERGSEMVRKWGNLCGWSRMEADPEIYPGLERRIGRLIGCERVHLLHTITMVNFSILPALAQKGMIFTDQQLHTVVWEACRLARDHGATITRFRHQDLSHLEDLLHEHRKIFPKVIAVDGVYSISTELAPIRGLQALCEKYGAWLYVDDAHGFGILGERPGADNPYGERGNGVVNYFGGNYDRTFYVSSFGKAFCANTAFTTIPIQYQENLRASSLQYLFSNPPHPYLIGTVEAVLDLNERRGEEDRRNIRDLVSYFVQGLRGLGLPTKNELSQPVVFIEIGTLGKLMESAKTLWDGGVVAGLRAFPVVPEDRCGMRFAISALHTRAHLDRALTLLADYLRNATRSFRKAG